VVKAQIHAGGRGKGKFKELGPDAKGGVRLAKSLSRRCEAHAEGHARQHAGDDPDRCQKASRSTASTSPMASISARNSTSRCSSTARPAAIAVVASTEGGMDIETVAHDTPEKIHTITIDPATGLMPHHGRSVAKALGLTGDLAKQVHEAFSAGLYERLPRHRCLPDRDQPARHLPDPRRRQAAMCSTPRSASIRTRCSATRISPNCAT
jgi:succinyl-CoA synthetase beta subunit